MHDKISALTYARKRAAHERYYARFHALGALGTLQTLQEKLAKAPWLIHIHKFKCELEIAEIRAKSTAGMELYWEEKLAELNEEAKANFNPAQPRVPTGNPDGGQWTDTGGNASRQAFQYYLRTGRRLVADSGAIASDASDSANFTTDQQTDDPNIRGRGRQKYVLQGGGGKFQIVSNPKADSSVPFYEHIVRSDVRNYEAEIALVSADTGIDANLIKSIIYVETTHGNYLALGPLADKLGISGSILPMNIQISFWGKYVGSREALNVPLNNIQAGAQILRGIMGNLEAGASIAKIATLYNNLGAITVNNYGARVEAVYYSKPWEKE